VGGGRASLYNDYAIPASVSIYIRIKVKVKLNLEKATKAQRGSRRIDLLFL